MNRLLEIGFQPAGHWLLEGNQLTFELARHSAQENILYAFVCDGEVKYVGKTTRTLATRMAGYKRPGKTQTTNINNHRRIREFLAGGVAVEIFACWVRFVAGLRPELVVNFDWTEFEDSDQSMIVLGMQTGHGRSTPLVWKTVTRSELKDRRNASPTASSITS